MDIDNKVKVLNKELIKELNIILNHKYKYLIKDIVTDFKKRKDSSIYYMSDYNFIYDLTFDISIHMYKNCENIYGIYLNCFVDHKMIYKNEDDEDDIDAANILHIYESDLNLKKTNSITFKIASFIDFLDNLPEKYIYSKYYDQLILKSKLDNMLLVSCDKDRLCKNKKLECIVCYDQVHSLLITSCCSQPICRYCVQKITPLKCPNCRTTYY